MTTDRLAALLHGMDVCLQNPSDHDDYCSDLAARLTAAGVTVAPQPADEPSCCELACYEDPGCACEGCTNPAERLREAAQAAAFALDFHNKTPTGRRRSCDPKCIACAAIDALRAALATGDEP